MTGEELEPPLTDAQRKLRAWAAAHAADAPRISPADAAPLIAIFRAPPSERQRLALLLAPESDAVSERRARHARPTGADVAEAADRASA